MVSSFTHIACAKKLRGLRQKLDALRVQNGQSLSEYQGFGRKLIYYKGISFFKLIWTPDFLCVQNALFKATSSIFHPFWLHLLFFMHLLIILSYKTMKLKIIWNEVRKGCKLMMWLWMVHFEHRKTMEFKKWNPFVTDEFPYKTLILRKRLSVLYTKCIQFLP